MCRPYRAQTKGKVESGVKYVKRNFLPGRVFRDLEDFNEQLAAWQAEVADLRDHGTTHEPPIERFAREAHLQLFSGYGLNTTSARQRWVSVCRFSTKARSRLQGTYPASRGLNRSLLSLAIRMATAALAAHGLARHLVASLPTAVTGAPVAAVILARLDHAAAVGMAALGHVFLSEILSHLTLRVRVL